MLKIILLAILAIILLGVCFCIVCALCVNPHKEYVKNSRFYRTLLYNMTAIVLFVLRIHVNVTGAEKLTERKQYLFVGNHRSNFDPIIEWQMLKKWDLAFISKDENFKIPIFGRWIRKCCFMAIDRENPREAVKTIMKASELLKAEEVSIAVYPEGTRSKDCVLLPFHDGVFRIAKKADAPIAVMVITGTEKIHKNIFRRASEVHLDIVGIISAEEAAEMSTHEIGHEVRKLIGEKVSQ